ncbi:hypothetical protein DJ031_13985 [bacterium endosymbiont of Escarpia laminata]|nr:MAG: hypothetical protein DJ031_13985 [bacterium endosymbiont of Escarpia laminata]
MKKQSSLLWLVAALLLAAFSAVAVYKVWPLLHPEVLVSAPLDSDCDLRAGPCRSVLPDGSSISFSIEPRSLPLVRPIQLQVEIEGLEAERIEVDFSGVDMNMGFNRPALANQGEGRFAGKGMLPVCVRDAMEWEAKVLVKTQDGLVAAPYRFITVKPGTSLPGN